jgi:VWFA-related protein
LSKPSYILTLSRLFEDRMMAAPARLVIGVSSAVALVVTVFSQGPDQSQRPTFRTEANYVRVDVFPTQDGQPVLDLRQDEFELLDEGVPQKIEQFERIVIRGNTPQELRREPQTVAESRAMLDEGRSRVFVLFLDAGHVGLASSRTIRKPLVDTLDDLIGADDLVGVMTSDMSASDVTFARKTTTIQGFLERYWWGNRDRLNSADPVEEDYKICYPPGRDRTVSVLAQELIDRRREKMTLDAMEDLVRFVRGVREERKAILVITEGWRLFRPNNTLLNREAGGIPGPPPVGIDPRTGRLSTNDAVNPQSGPLDQCDRDRMRLAQIDNEQQFYRFLDEANRANASFYPVDPRGLPVFDSPIGPDKPPPLQVDAAMLRTRQNTLRTLAEATDGLALVNTNQIAAGLKRIVTDLSSYYLLGYYASNIKMDGRFHKITVRVKRPGVQVRARRGYLAPTEAELTTASAAAAGGSGSAGSAAAAAEAAAIETALGPLGGFSRELPLRVQVVAGWKTDTAAGIWAVGELGTGPDWKAGGEAEVMVATASGATVATGRTRFDPGTRSFRIALDPSNPIDAGEYVVRVRVRGLVPEAIPATDVIRLQLPDPPQATGAILVRRGPQTGNREIVTADLRFRRTEQLRVEIPTTPDAAWTARLLDRTGKPLVIPVTVARRAETGGPTWVTAQVVLAPLAVGDYLIELTADAGASRTLLGIRIVP